MSKYYSKEHDLLKLCDRLDDKKIHYCPDCISDKVIFDNIKKVSGFRALKHHCIFGSEDKKHCCNWQDFYPITKEDLFLTISDVKASTVSRKLNIGFRKGVGKHERIIWNTYNVWINKKINECIGKPPDDATVLEDIIKSKDIKAVFTNRKDQIKQRSEDAWKFPFSSLMTHSELTEKWFDFFVKNNNYFGVPDQINTISEAKEISANIQGSGSKQNPKKGLPITFVRLKLFANHNLSRIVDTEIIKNICKIIDAIPQHFKNSQELYTLYDEIVFIISEPQKDLKIYIEEGLHTIKEFTTNYYCEGNYATARLINGFKNKELLIGYDKLFQEFKHTFYPQLADKLEPDLNNLGEKNKEAYSSKLCELCNMAEATITFWKFNEDEENKKIHECLCKDCFAIRDHQREINKAIKEGGNIPHGIGYKIVKWEDRKLDSKLCFIKIDLNLTILNDLFKEILINEFPLKTPTEEYSNENIGFSIVYEFLTHYNKFLASFKEGICNLRNFKSDFIDIDTGVSNEFQILENFICLRFDEMSEMKDIIRIFVETYIRSFPQFTGLHDSKNKNDFPITFSATISNIKFPFFEAWRYLNRPKENLINILTVRKFELVMDYREYQHLSILDLNGKRISSFLHKLVEIEGTTGSAILINTEIFNNKNSQNEIFHGISKNYYDVTQLINLFKLTRR